MNDKKYIGGAFAADDSKSFRVDHPSDFFESETNSIGFETGADAIAWVLSMELKTNNYPVYFPLHYCEETIDRILLKTPELAKVERYSNLPEIKANAIVIWNHFNGYIPVPKELLNEKYIVLEDCVQSLEAIHNLVGKAGFTSLRKWLELDIAVVIGPYEHESQATEESEYYQLKKEAEQLKSDWKNGASTHFDSAQHEPLDNLILDEKGFLDKFADAEKALQTSEISFHGLDEIHRYDWNKILEQRRVNAKILIDYLVSKNVEFVEKSELFVMIKSEKRDEIRKHLAQNGIFCPVHWLDSADKTLAKTLLSLPIDQRYNSDDMQRIVSALENGFKISGL